MGAVLGDYKNTLRREVTRLGIRDSQGNTSADAFLVLSNSNIYSNDCKHCFESSEPTDLLKRKSARGL